MDGFTLNISWEYFLGIVGFLIAGTGAVAWYTNGRFTALETSMQWVKETLSELKVSSDNAATPTPLFSSHSPVNLNPIGEAWLVESGLKEYIDTSKDELMKVCEEKRSTNPYEVQKHVFKHFDTLAFPPELDDRLKKFAFEKGSSMAIVRRVGAIYFRNLCLTDFGMDIADLDRHDPSQGRPTGN